MSTIVKSLQTSIQEVTGKISPLRGTEKFDRLSLYIKSKTGGIGLASYLGDANVTDEAKITLNDDIVSVIDGGKWAELPAVPNGQAERPTPPAPAVPITQVLVTPAPTRSAAPVAAPAALPTVAVAPAAPAPVAPVAGIDPMTAAIVAAVLPHIKAALPATAPAAPVTIDVNLIRNMVREEIATIFAAIAKGIK